MVINILKNGTVVEDMSTVTVPKALATEILKIYQTNGGNDNGKRINSQRTSNG